MKHTIQEENWREAFDHLPTIIDTETRDMGVKVPYRMIYKDDAARFISSLLASQLQSILEEVEGMKKNKRADFGRETSWEIENKNGYYEAINDVQSIISNRMEK